ncbi:hypothetical protein NIES267_61870 [Calothrix parasitica NIES-267]|uniref:LPS-assembly protein LptD n=1 Tax=Calothrix parasitica NIES-267 TaxID=1973488 RepID=A0A1Z4LZK8_9CYAN|nr:hypothetical protein NIES267_61870 [Calothrix parasitica NIES-267]
MTVKIKLCIFIPSFSIWLASGNHIASAKNVNYLLKEKNESCSKGTNEDKKHHLVCKNAFRENLRAKFKHYRYHNNQSKPKIESIEWFDNNHQNLPDKEQLSSSFNNLNASLLNQKSYKLAQQNFISSNNFIQKIKKRKQQLNLIKRISQQRKPVKVINLNSNSTYILPPTVAAPEKIHPFTTTLPLNDVPISHLTDWELYTSSTFGDDNNTSISAGGILKLSGQVTESVTQNNIYTVDQKGSYLQLQRIRQNRKVELTRNEPQTILGMQMQMSFVASCLTGEDIEGQKCSYTPGLITDRNSIDPDFFVPTRIVQTSNMNEVVTPESLAVMRLPGFQTGANGQEIGLDLYFPNAGAFPGNTQGNQVFYDRKEEINNTQIGLYSKVRQIVKANHKKAVIGRTIRGFGLVTDSDNLLLNSAVQLGNLVLPDVKPRIAGSIKKVNTNINRNLFLAANAVRIPTSSYTFYQAGIGSAESLKPGIKKRSQIPRAKFNSLWIGISPIIERRIEKITRYQPTGNQRIISNSGGEGGVDSNVSLLSVVNGENFAANEIEDFYGQIYLTNFAQDVNLVTGNRFVEDIKYYPHISLTGNVQGSFDSWKYYTGVIAGQEIKAYAGSDYTRNFGNLNISTGAIGYINPDRDYYSQVYGNLSQKIGSRKTNLVLSSRLNYAWDRENRIGNIESEAPASFVTIGARANLGNVSFGLVNYFDDILPDSVDKTLLADIAINFGENFRLSGYYTPINEASSRSRYGATAQLRLGGKYNSPTLSLSWINNDYDLGQDSDGIKLRFTDNVFKVLFRIGGVGNPFNKVDNKRILRRKRKNLIDRLLRGRT